MIFAALNPDHAQVRWKVMENLQPWHIHGHGIAGSWVKMLKMAVVEVEKEGLKDICRVEEAIEGVGRRGRW